MDHAATARRAYGLLNDGDIDGFGDMLADDFVEHEQTPGLAPTKDGVLDFFRIQRAAFPDMRMDPEDVPGRRRQGRRAGEDDRNAQGPSSWAGPRPGRASTCSSSTSSGSAMTVSRASHWGVFDLMTMMQQLGAVPDRPPA